MNEFDRKLNLALHHYKAVHKKKMYEIADEAGIPRNTLYKFTSGTTGGLNSENTGRLMKVLGLSVDLKEVGK